MNLSHGSLLLVLPALLALGLPNVGCKPDLIPGSSVEDTEENRRIIDFLGSYRRAIVERNVEAVLSLCAPDYFEDNATVDQADDYGLEALRQKLTGNFQRTKEIQLEIIVQRIERPEGDQGPALVTYRYNERALVNLPAGEKWISVSDTNRLVVMPHGEGGFRIRAGL